MESLQQPLDTKLHRSLDACMSRMYGICSVNGKAHATLYTVHSYSKLEHFANWVNELRNIILHKLPVWELCC